MTSACRSSGSTPVWPFGSVTPEIRCKSTAYFLQKRDNLSCLFGNFVYRARDGFDANIAYIGGCLPWSMKLVSHQVEINLFDSDFVHSFDREIEITRGVRIVT